MSVILANGNQPEPEPRPEEKLVALGQAMGSVIVSELMGLSPQIDEPLSRGCVTGMRCFALQLCGPKVDVVKHFIVGILNADPHNNSHTYFIEGGHVVSSPTPPEPEALQ